jgi:hypothetical protein
MTLLLVNLLAKADLVSKNVSKRDKMVNIGWSLRILTFLLTDAISSNLDRVQIYMPVLVSHFYFTNSLLTARLQCNWCAP